MEQRVFVETEVQCNEEEWEDVRQTRIDGCRLLVMFFISSAHES